MLKVKYAHYFNYYKRMISSNILALFFILNIKNSAKHINLTISKMTNERIEKLNLLSYHCERSPFYALQGLIKNFYF